MNSLQEMFAGLPSFGDGPFTLWTAVFLTAFAALLLYSAAPLKRWIAWKLLARSGMRLGVRQALASAAQYGLLLLGLMVALQTAGLDLTTVKFLAGALGLGVGFGLQNIVNNFVSGLIILLEQPIKIGDRIEIGGVIGQVVEINARSTTIVTNDNIAFLVPNSKLISENLINWSYNDDKVRFKVPFTVAYRSDPKLVETLLLEAARECSDVLQDPEPTVRLMSFGDSGIHFELRVWTSLLMHRPGQLLSAINLAVLRRFRARGVEIPFPQRDVRLFRSSAPDAAP